MVRPVRRGTESLTAHLYNAHATIMFQRTHEPPQVGRTSGPLTTDAKTAIAATAADPVDINNSSAMTAPMIIGAVVIPTAYPPGTPNGGVLSNLAIICSIIESAGPTQSA